ncbi:Hsp20/alpha crystallin family protein [Candidatus Woesearchaeota archaeon]|nr:Hsp20/alpha crystallin family protein [Candidatus Woesearchaeota archaeon]
MARRWTLWGEMRRMQEEMDRMFENFYGPYDSRRMITGPESKDIEISNYRQPLSDVWETDNAVIATLEMPGVSKEEIGINVRDNMLEVKVEKKQEKEDKKKGIYRLERSYRGFYKCFALPANVRADEADATYKNGVLEIKIPKTKEERDKRKKIEVK